MFQKRLLLPNMGCASTKRHHLVTQIDHPVAKDKWPALANIINILR
jgi:hypothetical protein